MDNNFSVDLTHIPKELKLILEILKNRNEESLLLDKFLTDINWRYFFELVKHHRLYPLIYSQLKKIDGKLVPPYIIKALHQEYKKNTFQMLLLSGEMEQISKLFTEHHIRLLFLKGPVIAADIYGDISLRTSKDLDILIPISYLKKVEELLLSLGYETDEVPNVLNEWKWRYHHVVYFHPQKNIQIEIHWRLHPLPSKEPTFNELWTRKRVSAITSYPVYFLGKEDLFLYLVSHGARHGWFRLRWLLDIDQMLRKGFPIEKTNIFLKKYRYRHLAGQALILASQLFKTPIDGGLKKLTEGNNSKILAKNSLVFIKGTESLATIMSSTYYKRYLFSLKSNSQKFFFILILFYPSSSDPMTLRLPESLHFLYFPLRPFLWVWRKTRKPHK
ncbi:nucleotidyltransferase domain-containing protein [Peribacillus castrilensis]|uniref:nucleotidyltransferase domain-containing protein n=1 Tax=Peribacillus TaxID=2675229 RepID=UPI0030F7A5AD